MTRRRELAFALLWFVFGLGVAVASWRMDRLSHLGVEVWSVPGLTPGVIGVLMMVLAVALGWQAARGGESGAGKAAVAEDEAAPPAAFGAARRTWLAAFLCIAFAGVTLGRGVPFVVAGSVFVFVFTAIFSIESWREEARVARGLVQTAVVAAIACALIAGLFERVFLVRLP